MDNQSDSQKLFFCLFVFSHVPPLVFQNIYIIHCVCMFIGHKIKIHSDLFQSPPPSGSAHKTSCSAVNYSCPNTAITMSNLQPLYSQSPIKGNDIHAYPQQQHVHTDSRPRTGRGCNRKSILKWPSNR